jgi:hypothetical protein
VLLSTLNALLLPTCPEISRAGRPGLLVARLPSDVMPASPVPEMRAR